MSKISTKQNRKKYYKVLLREIKEEMENISYISCIYQLMENISFSWAGQLYIINMSFLSD